MIRSPALAALVFLLATIGPGCLPEVEHEVALGDWTLRYQRIAAERVSRTASEYVFRATLTASDGGSTPALPVRVTSGAAATVVVAGDLFFPAGAGGPAVAAEPFVIRHDRTAPFDPASLSFAVVTAPGLRSRVPDRGESDVPVTVWPVLEFEAPVPATVQRALALACEGVERPVVVHAVAPDRWVVNPDADLPLDAACELTWPGPAGPAVLPFTTTAATGSATVLYDRTDTGTFPPFPDDLHLAEDPATSTGHRVAVPIPDRPPDVVGLSTALLTRTRSLDGWSPLGAVVVQLSEAPDPTSLPTTVAESLDPAATVGLFDLTPGSPAFGERIPFALTVRADRIGSEPLTHQLVAHPGRPLSAEGRYGFVLTRRVLTAAGPRPFGPSAFQSAALAPPAAGEDDLVARARTLATEVLDGVAAGPLPIPPDDVALLLSISVRSTDGIPSDALAMKADVRAAPTPALSFGPTDCVPGLGSVAAVVRGTWNAPVWRDGPFLARDASGRPVLQGEADVPFVLALPDAALEGPVPVVMYQHGNPGSPEEVRSEARDYLADAGFGVIGFTDILNDQLGDVQAQFLAIFGVLLGNLGVPDVYVETYGQQMAFLELIAGLDTLDVLPLAPGGGCGGDGVPDLDPSLPLGYVGISFGGVHGAALAPYAPELRAMALVAGGGGFAERLFFQTDTDPDTADFFFNQLPAVIPNVRASDLWVGLQWFQMIFDDQDPNNHAAFTYAERFPVAGTLRKPSVLIMEGLRDTQSRNNTTRAEAFATGPVPQVAPIPEPVPYLEQSTDRIVAGNVDALTTSGLVQYVPLGVPGVPPSPGCGFEGHFCVQGTRPSELQRAAFFRTALTDEAPAIVDPTLDSDGDGIPDVQEIFDGTGPGDPLDP